MTRNRPKIVLLGMMTSVCVSTFAVASSRIKMRGRAMMARAKLIS